MTLRRVQQNQRFVARPWFTGEAKEISDLQIQFLSTTHNRMKLVNNKKDGKLQYSFNFTLILMIY